MNFKALGLSLAIVGSVFVFGIILSAVLHFVGEEYGKWAVAGIICLPVVGLTVSIIYETLKNKV